MNYLLYIIAYILGILFIPIGMIYALFKNESSKYYYKLAISIDQLGNVAMSKLFNDIIIQKNGYKFGNEDETISSVLGRNKKTNTLKLLGRILDSILDKIEKDHSVKSIGS